MTRLPRMLRLVAAASLAGPAAAAAQPADTAARAFVVLRGTDTLAAERFTRTAQRVRGELVTRAPAIRQSFDLALGAAGTVTRLDGAIWQGRMGADDPPMQRLVMRFDSSGALFEMAGQTIHHVTPAGSLPFINLSVAFLEQILVRARALGGDSAAVPVVTLAGAQNVVATVRWIGADSAVLVLGPELRAHVAPSGEILGAVVPAQGVRFVRTAGAPPPALAAADYSAPPGAPYTAEEVRVRNEAGGVTLAGTLTVPRRAPGTRVPAVVLITGSGSQDRDESSLALPGWRPFRQIADTLGRRGIAVLRLDDRGVGGSERGPADATTESLAGDVRAALAFLRARPDIDPARLALLGHSEGGIIAPMVAVADSALRAVVLVAAQSRPGRTISDAQIAQMMDEQGITGARRDSLLRVNDRARDSLTATTPWLRFWMSYDPLPTARRVRQPVLIVQGATDRQVTADQAEELAAAVRAGGNADVTVRVFPDVNHLLVHDPSGAYGGYGSLPSYDVVPEVLGAIAEWLARRLGTAN